MDTHDSDLLPEGLEDRLPREAAATTRVMRSVQDVMHGHGYDRVLPPMIEFERSLAARMDGINQRRMFRFVDPASLRTLALRSDITVQVGRIAAEFAGLDAQGYAACCEAIARMDLRADLHLIKTSTLIIAGLQDPATPPAMAQELEAGIASAKLVTLDPAAHLLAVEQPAAVAAQLSQHVHAARAARD